MLQARKGASHRTAPHQPFARMWPLHVRPCKGSGASDAYTLRPLGSEQDESCPAPVPSHLACRCLRTRTSACRRELGDFERAEAALLRALRADADQASWLLLGDLYARNGRNAAALDAYRNALVLAEPCDTPARAVRVVVAKLLVAEQRGAEALALLAEMTLDPCEPRAIAGDQETQRVVASLLLQLEGVGAAARLYARPSWSCVADLAPALRFGRNRWLWQLGDASSARLGGSAFGAGAHAQRPRASGDGAASIRTCAVQSTAAAAHACELRPSGSTVL